MSRTLEEQSISGIRFRGEPYPPDCIAVARAVLLESMHTFARLPAHARRGHDVQKELDCEVNWLNSPAFKYWMRLCQFRPSQEKFLLDQFSANIAETRRIIERASDAGTSETAEVCEDATSALNGNSRTVEGSTEPEFPRPDQESGRQEKTGEEYRAVA
jgi:hypothetical protein